MNIKLIKNTAKQKLTGYWGIAIGVFFITLLVSRVAESFLFILAFFFISSPLAVGYQWFHLAIKRQQNPSIETLFDGFKLNYFRNALTNFLIFLFTLLWSVLLIIPGIIKALAYSMTLFILRDRSDLTALQAITESRRIMNGKKKDLFVLYLSFLPWFIIPIVLIFIGIVSIAIGADTVNDGVYLSGMASLIIGYITIFGIAIYLAPFITTSLAVFYDDYVKPSEGSLIQNPLPSTHNSAADHIDLAKRVE
ncbi:DUF975 family protein [Pradoshia sp. D12]|uniref:DUF975 family protein n=1 Tax=Bacillaceae TaxID=186817 RepID=UPI00111FC694|nr:MULTISPECIES: DUF975 family protein [Bacillaceae]QFK70260.1 DUF975 family protein [Pradoshia sp. D12]TPF71040.1 DUF975 family protein [Bacillus sp. D12]